MNESCKGQQNSKHMKQNQTKQKFENVCRLPNNDLFLRDIKDLVQYNKSFYSHCYVNMES